MTEEEKTLEYLSAMRIVDFNKLGFIYGKEEITNTLNLIQKQQKEIEKLRNKNKDLLRKLRNRVKEVKKLLKYSLYKKEFSRLNNTIEKKNKIIDLMLGHIDPFRLPIEEKTTESAKQYFESKVEHENT